jgi:hypothetical protein
MLLSRPLRSLKVLKRAVTKTLAANHVGGQEDAAKPN